MSTKIVAKFKAYYSAGNYTRTGNKDSRGVIVINNGLRDISHLGHEMELQELTGTGHYYTHRIKACDNMPSIVGCLVHRVFLSFLVPVEIRKIKIKKVWGE